MVARPNAALAQIHTQIMWSRLIAVVEEQAQTMLRTAFSTSVREAGDLSAGVFDRHSRMLAQAVTGTPGHVNSMANAVRHDLLRLVRANVREPLQVEGDIYATAACNDEGSRRLVEMMDEFEIANLDRLGETIIEASREATLGRIRALPKGTYRNSMTMDGYNKPLVLNAALTISDDGIHVDFAGTSPASSHGINVVYNYCLAYTAFGVKCLVAPEVPNNAGSLAPISVSAPEGCVLNVKRPWPVAARHTVGQMLPDVVFGCLQQVMPVPAEGASSLWNPQIFGGGSLVDEVEEGTDANALPEFSTVIFHCGGAGARPTKDGLSATAFPSGVRTIPVEATESVAPVVFYRREFRERSGGAGKLRGGLGQVIELGGAGAAPVALLCNFERVHNPARGRQGGRSGAAGAVALRSGRPIRPKGRQTVPPRDAIRLELPGGGGVGDPRTRDPHRVLEDVLDGFITAEDAERDYAVVIDAEGRLDLAATARLRKGNASADTV